VRPDCYGISPSLTRLQQKSKDMLSKGARGLVRFYFISRSAIVLNAKRKGGGSLGSSSIREPILITGGPVLTLYNLACQELIFSIVLPG